MMQITENKKLMVIALAIFFGVGNMRNVLAYSFNEVVPDVRQPLNISGGSACPVRSHQLTAAASISVEWSTALSSNPVTVITSDHTTAGSLNESDRQ